MCDHISETKSFSDPRVQSLGGCWQDTTTILFRGKNRVKIFSIHTTSKWPFKFLDYLLGRSRVGLDGAPWLLSHQASALGASKLRVWSLSFGVQVGEFNLDISKEKPSTEGGECTCQAEASWIHQSHVVLFASSWKCRAHFLKIKGWGWVAVNRWLHFPSLLRNHGGAPHAPNRVAFPRLICQ